MNRQEEVEALLRAFAARDVAAIRALGEAELDLDAPGGGGLTVLMRAILRGQLATVEWILAAGADPDAPSANGETPIALARSLDRTDLVDLLLAAGAEPSSAPSVADETPEAITKETLSTLAKEPRGIVAEEMPDTLAEEPRVAAERPIRHPLSMPSGGFDDRFEDAFDDRFADELPRSAGGHDLPWYIDHDDRSVLGENGRVTGC